MILTAQHRTPTTAIFADGAGRRLEIPLDDPFANEQRIRVLVFPSIDHRPNRMCILNTE